MFTVKYPFEKEGEYQKPIDIKHYTDKVENNEVKVICSTIAVPPNKETIPYENLNILEATEDPAQTIAEK